MTEIRRAVASDAAVLTALMLRSSAYRGRYAAILEGYAISPEQLARDLMYAAEVDGAIAGFYSLAGLGSCPSLDLLFVDDLAQGLGLGAMLFAHMRGQAHRLGLDEVRIVAHPPAEGFYLRMGAVRYGESAPTARVHWARPVLVLRIDGAPVAREAHGRDRP